MLAAARQFHHIESIIEHQKKYENDITSEPFVVRLISLYGKSKMYEHARKLFDQMPQLNCSRTILSFHALLSACVNSGKYEKMAELFRDFPVKLSIKPDTVSYNIVIKAFVDSGAIDAAIVVISKMEKDGCEPDLITFNTIIDALYKKNELAEADKVWELMESKNIAPDARSYNAKLRGLCALKRVSDAVDVIKEMEEKGIKPTIYIYNGLIQGFCKENNLSEVKKWYGEIFKNEIRPDYKTFSIAVPFACEAGDFGFAYKLSKEALCRKGLVGADVLQRVVDGLVKDSEIKKAEEIVELGKLNKPW